MTSVSYTWPLHWGRHPGLCLAALMLFGSCGGDDPAPPGQLTAASRGAVGDAARELMKSDFRAVEARMHSLGDDDPIQTAAVLRAVVLHPAADRGPRPVLALALLRHAKSPYPIVRYHVFNGLASTAGPDVPADDAMLEWLGDSDAEVRTRVAGVLAKRWPSRVLALLHRAPELDPDAQHGVLDFVGFTSLTSPPIPADGAVLDGLRAVETGTKVHEDIRMRAGVLIQMISNY